MASNSTNSPRQRMINLMYLVFIAMLALNVSSEVLDGFELVEESLLRSVKASTGHNDQTFGNLKQAYENNPEKTEVWFTTGEQVKAKTDSLYNYIQDLKVRIVQHADGKEGDPERLKNAADLNASLEVMFERGKNDGEKLRNQLDDYRTFVAKQVSNPSIKQIIENNLSTQPSEKAIKNNQSWEESLFWNMPMAAAITLLTKLQNDIRYAEGQVLSDLIKNIDIKDIRVNEITAFVIPESQTVMAGGSYRANIILAAIDTTQRPTIFVNGRELSAEANGQFVAGAGSPGTYPVKGYIEMPTGDGDIYRREFSTEYFVTQPSATIAPVLMNVLYAGIPNDISIAAPGATSQNVQAVSSNGTLTRKNNDIWTVTPRMGSDAVITISARMPGGRVQEMGKQTFRVRQLPDPMAFLYITDAQGNRSRFRGGALSQSVLTNMDNLNAAIDDGILDITFNVVQFDITTTDNYGMTIRQPSDGPRFSQAQKDLIRRTKRGKTVLVTRIVTRGPDGTQRDLKSPIEIIIN